MDEEARRRRGRRLNLGPDDDTGGGGGPDLISALPDDLLHEVLVRLRCARAAARTSLVSRRWRALWTRLPDLVFRNATLARTLPALASIQQSGVGLGVSLLDIRVPTHLGLDDAGIPSLFHAAAGLSPLDFTLSLPRIMDHVDVELPPFRRATSIKLSVENLRITLPPPWRGGGGPIAFPKLEELYLKLPGCYIDLAALVLGCPSLRVLWVVNVSMSRGIDIRSESLQDLYVHIADSRSTYYINVEAPVLKTVRMLFYIKANDLSVSIVAPVLEKVSWKCSAYSSSRMVAGFGPWGLSELSLHAAAQSLITGVEDGVGEDTCLQLPNANNVLSLKMTVHGLFDAEFNCVEHIERHLVTDFSILELIMEYDYDMGSTGHVYGPFVLHLLESHVIRNATRRLQLFSQRSRVKNYCPVSCLCDEPKNWRSKNISLINLEEVVIDGFEWEDHEFDFLKVIFRCAPMLKSMVVGTVYKVTTSDDWCTKLYDIFKAYPSVECKLIPH